MQCPKLNGGECHFAWSGEIPCTGIFRCIHCLHAPTDEEVLADTEQRLAARRVKYKKLARKLMEEED